MSVGADSLMGHLDMSKLLDKEALERGRAAVKMESHNLQIGEVIDAIAQTEPELFGEGTATLMPVNQSSSLDIPIFNARINDLGPYDEPVKQGSSKKLPVKQRNSKKFKLHHYSGNEILEMPGEA